MEELKYPPVAAKLLNFLDNGEDLVPVEGHKAIVNPETGHVYDIVSDKYKLVKHEEVIENVEEVLVKDNQMGAYERSTIFYQKGARMRTTYKFPDVSVPVAKNDYVNPTIEVLNSYDRSIRHIIMLGAFRLICTNGMVVGKKFMQFRKRHMPDLYLEDVKDALELGLDSLQQQVIIWQQWSIVPLEKPRYEATIKKLDLNKKETVLLLEEPETSTKMSIERWLALDEMGEGYEKDTEVMTWWVFYNILTQFTTHRIESHNRRMQLEGRIRQVLYN